MSDILFETVGRAGLITLNRPKALNALTEAMVLELGEALDEWAADDRIARVAIRGEGPKAFCAGGDIRSVYDRRAGAIDFFANEYRTNNRIAGFRKPYVSLIHGVCMGGGVGLSAHGPYRVANETLTFAMPETAIGLFPDVGATHLLSRMADEAGMWLGLTGHRIKRDLAADVGYVTHPVEGSLDAALDRVAHGRDLGTALDELVVEIEPMPKADRKVMGEAFAAESVVAVLDRLEAAESEFAAAAAGEIRQRSPTSLAITFEQIRRAAKLDPAGVLEMDFAIVGRVLDGHDLYEGVRAVLIDKDQAPQWDPADIEKVDPADIAAHFVTGPHGTLGLKAGGGERPDQASSHAS
ncbi:enoyl-CoA hydratase/isomerase family protein [Acuticoccus sp. I52.16.1]|uniref:enoyl-CoA hydratase/isomerase family protein n=1 Tax=Acuticoccus sp. I52.16.1 TaxID=2928472 RepID=UPI001FD4EFD0|nr:enoyl-CoA hydratase/isomerase family protein [Acuticoccus sp. I52.16.1]UOM33784.1 enoyl-CoA hydratase/isomerase family protein [Acuticoccus sp. I52.16.1]